MSAATPTRSERRSWQRGRAAQLVSRRWVLALKVAVVVVLLAWPLFSNDIYTLSWMTTAGLYLMLTIAVQLIIAQAGQLSFGHAAFYGIGAYTTGILASKTTVPSLVALIAAPVVTVAVALVIGRPVLRLKYFYLTLATIALASITGILVTQSQWAGGTIGLGPFATLNIFGFEVGTYFRQYYLVWIIALLILVLTQRALTVRFGRSLRAIATSEVAATTMGVRAPNWKLLAFVAGAAYCGLAGALFAFVFSAVSPTMFAFSAALIPVIMMLIGGADTLWGGLVGALLITYITNRLTSAQQYSGLIYSVILILLLLFLPMGLAGLVRKDRLQRLKLVVTRRRQADAVAEAVAADTGELAEQREVGVALPIYEHEAKRVAVDPTDGQSALLEDPEDGRPRGTGEPLLVVDDVSVVFGGLTAVDGVSMTVRAGDVHALIGPNGAGKTTLFNVISRLQKSSGGSVHFGDEDITRLGPAAVARLGMARTFQNLRIFANMSVLENVLVGCHRHERSGLVGGALGLPSQRREERRSLERAMGALRLVAMDAHANRPAASLPYGQQRLVEIARALASEPRLLLLDEPAAGMNATEREFLVQRIRTIRNAGITVLLVEHDIELVMGLSDSVCVLDHGRRIAAGTPDEVRDDPAVIEAYLGVSHEGTLAACELPALLQGESRADAALLRLEGVSTAYGAIVALHDVSFVVGKGEAVAILGANGAGKTTLLNTVSGVLRARHGSISFDGVDITRMQPESIAARGMCQAPEGRQLFPSLTVEDNLILGASARRDKGKLADRIAYVYELFPVLAERRLQAAGTLSGGEQQMVAIGRALTGEPDLLLLDEPSMGLAPLAVERIYEALAKLNADGLTMLVVEQNAEMALAIAHRGVVLQTGFVALRGGAAELMTDPRVRECYLGQA